MPERNRSVNLLLNEAPSTPWMRKHLTCGRCLLLEWATSDARDKPEFAATLSRLLNVRAVHRRSMLSRAALSDGRQVTLAYCYPQFAARLRLINAFVQDDADLADAIRHVAIATEHAWRHQTQDEIRRFEEGLTADPKNPAGQCREPSFMSQIDSPRYQKLLRDIASEPDENQRTRFGWSHPGIQMAGEILAALSGDARKVDLTVRTRVMFALPHPTHPTGILAEITVERISEGCGLLIPDAFRCGYLNMDREGTFSTGLQNALWAARNYAAKFLPGKGYDDFDWRWSIDLKAPFAMHEDLRDLIQMTVAGASGEVAFACALIAAHRDNPDNAGGIDPLDPHVGVTASIKSRTWGLDKLKGVGSIDIKTVLGQMERRRLLEVIIAQGQNKTLIPRPDEDNRFAFPEVSSVKDAYELMTRHPRLTRGVNRALKRRAKKLLTQYCTPYVIPAIKEIIDAKSVRDSVTDSTEHRPSTSASESTANSRSQNSKTQKRRTLKKWEKRQLVTGQLEPDSAVSHDDDSHRRDERWIGNRVRIFADSGLGKSVFILRCEYAIATADSGLLPLRLGRVTGEDASLGAITWNAAKPDHLIDGLADKLAWAVEEYLQEAREAENKTLHARQRELNISEQQLRDWFKWMVTHGKVIFLLDALDQVKDGVPGLGPFLGSGTRLKCPVIMTGRPEALRGHAEAFVDNKHWRTLELQPFNRKRQEKYLGEELAKQLIPEDPDLDYSADAEEIRRHQWKDLLEVPLLLSLLKELSTGKSHRGQLRNIQSRYELYRMAVDHLIDKGWNSLEAERRRELLESKEKLQEILGQVAWGMVCRHDPTNTIEGPAFAELRKDYGLGEATLNSLHQVDLITAFQVLDRADENGLAFRHRSFLEFFAGCHLMDRVRQRDKNSRKVIEMDRVPADDRDDILKQIHETCDSNGDLLPHMLQETRHRPAIWNDTLRFALSHASVDRRNQLAARLIEMGNPWVVYQSILRDDTPYSTEVEHLSRWLVHRDYPDWFDYHNAVRDAKSRTPRTVQETAKSAVAANVVDLEKVTHRSTRDAAYLYSLRELLPDPSALYASISAEAGLKECLTRLHSGDATWNFHESFATLKGGTFDLSGYADHKDIKPQKQKIKAFQLADFAVTNELFEVFCPTHRRHRDQYSNADDQPVVHVTWFMAMEFCAWLSALTGQQYRLPTEWEWEWACRWHNTLKETYWWGHEMNDEICWYTQSSSDTGTRRRCDTIVALGESGTHHASAVSGPELLDLSGNVWEWCLNPWDAKADPNDPGSSRVLRGGSWYYSAGYCRSADRGNVTPDYRNLSTGFRLVCE